MAIRPTGCFLILKQSQIEAIRDTAAALLASGKTVMAYTDSGTTISKSFPADPMTVMVECNFALKCKDPNQYGARDTVRVYNGLWTFRGM